MQEMTPRIHDKIRDKLASYPVGTTITDDAKDVWIKDVDGLWRKNNAGVRVNSLGLVVYVENKFLAANSKESSKESNNKNIQTSNEEKNKKSHNTNNKKNEMESLF